ncbi:hypothetical protein BH24ACI3_BH24ACI3_10700 [soil metagenome]
MDERMKYVTSEMGKIAKDVTASFGTLTEAQLNWKPAEKSWSIGQCLDHIIKTNHEFDPELARLASGNRKNSFWEKYSPFTGMGGRFLVNAVKTDSKKAKAPSKAIVPPSDIDAEIVNRFADHIADVNRKVEACSGVDLQKTVVTSPFLSVFTYKFDDALTVLVEHSKRHVRQAKRVMQADGFPG